MSWKTDMKKVAEHWIVLLNSQSKWFLSHDSCLISHAVFKALNFLTSQILGPKSSEKSNFILQLFKKLEPNICHENWHLLSLLLLEYVGNPDRNVQLSDTILNIARMKARPDLSARYLIRNLFPKQILMRSNVYGSTEHGIHPLNSNKIEALRGLLLGKHVRKIKAS